MYNQWKSTFVTGTGTSTKVIRPENGNDTVSEGIGYGMLIAVYVGDQRLFDGLWGIRSSPSASRRYADELVHSGWRRQLLGVRRVGDRR